MTNQTDAEYDAEGIRLDAALKPKLTDEFLSILVEAARTCGYSVDHVETVSFVEWCYQIAEKPVPDCKPYQIP